MVWRETLELMKKKTVQNVLTRYLENNKTISTSKLLELLAAEEAEVKISSIRWYLYEFKREGLIADVSRGVYSLQRHNFSPDLKLHNIKKLSNKIHSNLPFLKYCIWTTSWLSDLMIHQAATSLSLIEVEAGAENSVFSLLQDDIEGAFIKPTAIEIERYVLGSDKFVIKPLIHDAPITDAQVPIPRIEKILIDLFIEKDLFMPFQGKELVNIYANSFESFSVNLTTLLAYAERRKRKNDIVEYLNSKLKDKLSDTYRIALDKLA